MKIKSLKWVIALAMLFSVFLPASRAASSISPDTETTRMTPIGYAASMKTWDEIAGCEMIPFKAGIAAGTELIMTAHIAAPNVTGSDVSSTMSSVILQEKLRGELDYQGIIVTDAVENGTLDEKKIDESVYSHSCSQDEERSLVIARNDVDLFRGYSYWSSRADDDEDAYTVRLVMDAR